MNKSKGLIVGISTVAILGATAILGNQFVSRVDAQSIQSNITNVQAKITKEELHHRMLNSIDYFDSVTGSFIYHDISGNETTVDYKIKMKDNPSSYEKDANKDITNEISYDGNEQTFLDTKNKMYRKLGATKQTVNKDQYKSESPKDRYQSKDGKNVYIHRADPSYMGVASESVFPQNTALGFLEDYNKWDITSDGTLNGKDVVIVKGTLNNYYSAKFKATSFQLWVDKNTGILLKREVYNVQGDVVEFINTTSIKFNSSIDDAQFKLNVPVDYQDFKKVALQNGK